MRHRVLIITGLFLLAVVFACSDPLTTREKTAGAGAVVGSNVGAGIGSVSGYTWTGGVAGAALGLCAGFVIGGQVEALEKRRNDIDQKIQQCDLEIQRQSDKLEALKKELEER